MLLRGAQEAIVRPVRDTLSGDVRVTQDSADFAGGTTWVDSRPIEERLHTIPGAVAAARWEASQVTARSDRLENWTGGLLVGIDPSNAHEQEAIRSYLVWGDVLPIASTIDPATQLAYVPLLVGEEAAKRLDLHPGHGGGANFTELLRITSGRLPDGPNSAPLNRPAVVVGVFRSGLEVLDRFAVFAPIDDVRFLVGYRPGDSSANAIVVHGATLEQVEALGLDVEAQDADGVARQTIGLLLTIADSAALLAVMLCFGILALLLVREVVMQVTRDGPAVAALRAIGVPARTILASYAGLAAITVALAAVAAGLLATALALLGPPLPIRGNGLSVDIHWHLDWAPVLGVIVGAVLLAAVGAVAAGVRLGRLNVAEALRTS